MKRLVISFIAFVALALPALGGLALQTVPLVITTADGTAHNFVVEVANTFETRRDGLMGRTSMAADRGMLFVFNQPKPQVFWMKDTLIPLDMVFIAPNGRVLSIHENAKPQDLTYIYSGGPVLWVIELPGGRTKELGIAPGNVVTSPAIKPETAN